jgi:hypothetical protein
MKKLFIILFVLAAFTAKSQTIDTAFKSMTACKIQSFKAKWTDTVNVDHLGIRSISDDLHTTCTLYWALLDSTGTIHVDGNATISGADYQSWNGSNIFPFAFVGKLYNLVFIKPE